MDALGEQNAALVALAFLQADCASPGYGKALNSLREDVLRSRRIDLGGPAGDAPGDGDLETDGHPSSRCITADLGNIMPSVELQLPREYLDGRPPPDLYRISCFVFYASLCVCVLFLEAILVDVSNHTGEL